MSQRLRQVRTWKVDFDSRDAAEVGAKTALRVFPSPLRVRRVVIDGKTFVSLSADELIRAQSEASRARPGHLCD